MLEPGVQSVRIAWTLCDRFAELIRGPQAVTMTKESGALFGVGGNDEALSLRIGEVQQIYPEIWRHLDEARAAFAARGVDVSAFDRIRATEGPAIGANVDVQQSEVGNTLHIVKSANFNKEGLARARAACDALMKATPDTDWAGIAKREAEDPEIAAFGASTRRRRFVMFALLALLVASPFLYVGYQRYKTHQKREERRAAYEESLKLTAADKQRLQETVSEAKTALAASRKAWPQVTAPDALAAIVPGTGGCEYRFSDRQAADSFVQYGSIDANYFGRGTYTSYRAGQPIPDGQLAADAAVVERVAAKLAAGKATREDADELYRLESHAVFLVVDRQVEPLLTSTGVDVGYIAGELEGRAYVFSAHAQKIVCAGNVVARNAVGDVMLRTHVGGAQDAARGVLQRDLVVKIRQALASSLRSTGG